MTPLTWFLALVAAVGAWALIFYAIAHFVTKFW